MNEVTKRVRVQAGREGGPRAEFVPPAAPAPTNLPIPAGPEPTNFLAVIARAAADPRTDTPKMQALLKMQGDIEEREAKKAFTAAFIALQEELPPIRRDGKIEIFAKDASGQRPTEGRKPLQSTPYATFNNIMKVIKPLLIKYGFALSFQTEPVGERLLVTGVLDGHGHQRTSSFPLPAETSGSKNNVQGWGSSMSYGKRYCTIALLNIISEAPEDQDRDGHEGNFQRTKDDGLAETEVIPPLSKAQIYELRGVLEECSVSEVNFCAHYQIDKVEDLRSDLLEPAKVALRKHAKDRGQSRGAQR